MTMLSFSVVGAKRKGIVGMKLDKESARGQFLEGLKYDVAKLPQI